MNIVLFLPRCVWKSRIEKVLDHVMCGSRHQHVYRLQRV
jgi:hypothetical protein